MKHSLDSALTDYLKSSPNTINIYGYCAHAAIYDYASNSLEHSYEESKKMGHIVDSRTKVRYARDIAAGLAALHNINDANGTAMAVYLDLKPENFVVINDGVLLSDFNAAAMIMQSTGDSNEQCLLNTEGPYVGGKAFYAPEEWQNYSEKVDIYALGGIIHYLLVGHGPTDLLEPKELEQLYTSNDDPLIQALLTVTRKCHYVDPRERPHAKDIVRYLNSVLAGKSIALEPK